MGLLSFIGCDGKVGHLEQKPTVVVSFSILEDFVRNIAGDKVEIMTLVPRLSDPHTYQIKPTDMVTLKEAGLILAHGLGFEGWLKRVLTSPQLQHKYVEVAAHLNARTLPDGTMDPHTWHDVKLVMATIPEIVKALSNFYPEEKVFFERNAQAYLQKLKQVDKELRERFSGIPKEKRFVITTHDAFWYFGEAYGIVFLSPVGITTEQEPSATTVANLIDLIRSQNIKAIFIENLSNGRVVEQIAHETGSSPDGMLYADSISEESGLATNYIDMVRYNTQKIISAF